MEAATVSGWLTSSAALPPLFVLKSLLIAAVGLLLWRVLRRAAASARHQVLVATLVALVLLPLVAALGPQLAVPVPAMEATLPAVAARAPDRGSIRSDSTASTSAVAQAGDASVAVTAMPRRGLLETTLLAVYGAVAVALVLALLAALVYMARVTRRAEETSESAEWRALCAATLGARRVQCAPRLLLSRDVSAPLTWGVVRPIVLLPVSARRWPRAERLNAMRHELAHVARCDWPLQVLARLVCALYWFNPLIWLLARELNAEAEKSADDRVLSSGAVAHDYASQLLRLSRRAGSRRLERVAASSMAGPHLVARRIHSILNPGENRMPVNHFARFALFGAIGAVLLGIGGAQLTAAPLPAGESEPLPLIRAAADGDLETVQRLLQDGADVNRTQPRSYGPYQRSALVSAARGGHLRIVNELLAVGAPVDRIVPGDATALIEALRHGHNDVARALLDAGADANLAVRGNGSPLIAAAGGDDVDIVRTLLERGADAELSVPGDENPPVSRRADGQRCHSRDADRGGRRRQPGDAGRRQCADCRDTQ
ncbi:MAG: M56 family metallopeptidase [Woeseiaceae bacterium]|nr:M56 family metallopeptidase [Woeseiaceae bacterium]